VPVKITLDFPDLNGRPSRRLFRSPQRIVSTDRHSEITRCLTEVAADCDAGATAIGFISYEAAPAFDAAFVTHSAQSVPLLWFAVFEHEHVATSSADAGLLVRKWDIEPARAAHERAVARIREEIAAGRTYQVNYTGRMRAPIPGDPLEWYEGLRRAQGTGYHVCIETGDWCVLSLSPELFFETRGAHINTRPMKGTRARGRFLEEDHALVDDLRSSPKERAENLMIVDLMRNDLGRIAETGSVHVARLYDVERYPTVHQMTSTVEATLRNDVTLPDIMTALFPPGSVTGAPKISTMELIAELETSPRGVYCGAVGIVERGTSVFNVPIRTLWLDQRAGTAEYGTGGGITADSRAEAEYDELLTKARIISLPWPRFDLLETMRFESGEIARLEKHLLRLEESAEYFGFPFCEADIRAALTQALRDREEPTRVRLLVSEDGSARAGVQPLDPLPAHPRVQLAHAAVDSSTPFLFHKTTARRMYEVMSEAAPTAFDVLLYNERDEITEFTRGNVIVELEGRRYTPPVTSGLLRGIFRGELLANGEVEERVIMRKEIAHAARIWFVNSVREWVGVELV
jgi:para-aminobenzoate synthetase / 4-amino-4-deoxychorismate lyase